MTAVAVSTRGSLPLPEPGAVFALFPASSQGAKYFDDPALGVRAFTLPAENLRVIFERMRLRIEDTASRRVEDLPLGTLLEKLTSALFPKGTFDRHGFNYDVVYRYDQMIPDRKVLSSFVADDMLEDVSHFGWQFTLSKEKGKRRETYFCKVISPLEIEVLANIEFDKQLPGGEDAQRAFVASYQESQAMLESIAFLKP